MKDRGTDTLFQKIEELEIIFLLSRICLQCSVPLETLSAKKSFPIDTNKQTKFI